MTGQLSAWLDGERERLVSIEFAHYAQAVFAGGAANWLSEPNAYVGGLAQAQGVIGTEVLSIDVFAAHRARLHADGTVAPVQAALQDAAANAFADAIVDALVHRFGGRIDLVLQLPSPGTLLRAGGIAGEPSFDDLDDLTISAAAVLRRFADKPLAGIVIAADAGIGNDEAECLETIVGAAHHYRWRVGLRLETLSSPPDDVAVAGLDFLLLPHAQIIDVTGKSVGTTPCGGGTRRSVLE